MKMHTQEYKEMMSERKKQWWVRVRRDPERMKGVLEKMSKNNARNMLGKFKEKHPGWKGGRIVSKRDGYVLVIAPDGHPYAKKGGGGNKNKYILEHRLVIEKSLGRYVLPDEDVNHLNGIKNDNRIENLRLVRHYAHYEEMRCPKCEFVFHTR